MDKDQAKVILLLDNVEEINREKYFIAGKMQWSVIKAKERLNIMSSLGMLSSFQHPKNRKVFYAPIDQQIVDEAKEVLGDE